MKAITKCKTPIAILWAFGILLTLLGEFAEKHQLYTNLLNSYGLNGLINEKCSNKSTSFR